MENGDVTLNVTDDLDNLDPDSLRTIVAELKQENQSLKSNIGKQNNIHGQRQQELVERNAAQIQELRNLIYQREEESRKKEELLRRQSMSPADMIADKANTALQRVAQLEQQLAAKDNQQREWAMIQTVVDQAKKEGIPIEALDTSSLRNATLTFNAASNQSLKKRIAELEAKQQQDKEEVVEAVRVGTGARKVATGDATPPMREKLPANVKALFEQYETARATRNGTLAIETKQQILALGYELK